MENGHEGAVENDLNSTQELPPPAQDAKPQADGDDGSTSEEKTEQ